MEALEAIEIPVKRTYQKHKTEKKISIVHFPYSKIKPEFFDNEPYYPIYYRVTWNKRNTLIKSIVPGIYTENNYINPNNQILIEIEKKMVLYVISIMSKYESKNVSMVSHFAKVFNKWVFMLLETAIKKQIEAEINDIPPIKFKGLNVYPLEYVDTNKIVEDIISATFMGGKSKKSKVFHFLDLATVDATSVFNNFVHQLDVFLKNISDIEEGLISQNDKRLDIIGSIIINLDNKYSKIKEMLQKEI